MTLRTEFQTFEEVEYISMYVPTTGTQWMARAVWPYNLWERQAVMAELLRTIADAVKASKIPEEAFYVSAT